MARLLCIESSGACCSAALVDSSGEVLFEREEIGMVHAEKLAPFVEEALKAGQPDALVLDHGPGSYTGLRIGTSLVKGLAYGLSIPVITIPSTLVLATVFQEKYPDKKGWLIPMIDARRMEVYSAVYDEALHLVRGIEAEIITETSFHQLEGPKFLFGDGAPKTRSLLGECPDLEIFDSIFPSARYLAKPALLKFEKKEFENTAYFEPFYLKEFFGTSPKKLL